MPGYILFAPLHSRITYLIDRCGKQVHTWKSKYKPGQSVYLLPDGNLLRSANDSNMAFYNGGGRIEKLGWNSEIIWSYSISTPSSCLHHDIFPMPNGNVLAILWEKKSPEEAQAAGRNPELLGKSIWTERIIELKPKGKGDATIVWEWKVWDHLVQDFNPALPNYGEIAANPQLVNINFRAGKDEDWLHFNSVYFNKELNQVMISNRNHCEIYIIDHSTTLAQAASHNGGRYKKGGDILYRWGNPMAYNCGTPRDKKLFQQHSAHWIAQGLKDEGKIMVFNNGTDRGGEPFSSVDIIEPPVDLTGNYSSQKNKAYLPFKASWSFRDSMPEIFYSKNVSNAQRLPNGNTLICQGANGKFIEIDSSNNIIWKYINPVTVKGPAEQGELFIENQVFRCVFYGLKYPGLKGKKLESGESIERNPIPGDCLR